MWSTQVFFEADFSRVRASPKNANQWLIQVTLTANCHSTITVEEIKGNPDLLAGLWACCCIDEELGGILSEGMSPAAFTGGFMPQKDALSVVSYRIMEVKI